MASHLRSVATLFFRGEFPPMILPDRLIGYRLFADSANRPIFEQADGRQYVLLDEEGTKEYGVWLIREDEPDLPIIIAAKGG
jgi:hypothetical protein